MKKISAVLCVAFVLGISTPCLTTDEPIECEIVDEVIDGIRYWHNENDSFVHAIAVSSDLEELNIAETFNDFPVTHISVKRNENVKVLNIPSSAEDIFIKDCMFLEECNVDEECKTYASVNGILYNKDITTLYYYPSGKKDKIYKIPEGLVSIGNDDENKTDMFVIDSCKSLENIIFPNSLKTINSCSIVNCDFEYIELPHSVVSLGNCAFGYNKKLKEVVFYDGGAVPDSFEGCESLKTAVFLRTQPFKETFFQYSMLAEFILPDCFNFGCMFGMEGGNDVINDMNIYVPDSCLDNYQKALGEISHYNILPLSEKEKIHDTDINKNGNVEIFDAIDIQNFFVNKRSDIGLEMDVNNDSTINIVDVLRTKESVIDNIKN